MRRYELPSPTHGATEGCQVAVRGALVGHHVDGQPLVRFAGVVGQADQSVWVNPDHIVAVAEAPVAQVPATLLQRANRHAAVAWTVAAFFAALLLNERWNHQPWPTLLPSAIGTLISADAAIRSLVASRRQ